MSKIKVIHVQPSAFTDNLWSSDREGEMPIEGTKLPYPFDARADNGHILNQALWSGHPFRIVGFNDTPEPGKIWKHFQEIVEDPDQVLNKYVVTQDTGGGMAVHTTAIQEVKVYEFDEDQLW
jgi:hypothetical protein